MELPNLKILLAEHDPWITDAFERFFRCKGCFLVTVNSTEDGIGLLEKEQFDVVASEYELSGEEGLEIFKCAKSSNPDAVKILIINYGHPDPVPEEYKYAVDGIIEKPFPFQMFLEILSGRIQNNPGDGKTQFSRSGNTERRVQ